jgi:hypothetical protein
VAAAPVLLVVWIVAVMACAWLARKAWRLTKPFEEIETPQLGSRPRQQSRLGILAPFAMAFVAGGAFTLDAVRQASTADSGTVFVVIWLAGLTGMQAGWLWSVQRALARRAALRAEKIP